MEPDTPQNYCRRCKRDFASLGAFDKHFTPDDIAIPTNWNPNPQRCLDADELEHAGMELDPRGRWRFLLTEKKKASLAALKAS
jgi:hypothetical protein